MLDKCAICILQAANKGKPPIKPIKAKCYSNRILIDLMDFRAEANGEYKWILQIQCPFSRYVWLYALKDKSALAVCAILVKWFGDNGLCSKLYVFFLLLKCLIC